MDVGLHGPSSVERRSTPRRPPRLERPALEARGQPGGRPGAPRRRDQLRPAPERRAAPPPSPARRRGGRPRSPRAAARRRPARPPARAAGRARCRPPRAAARSRPRRPRSQASRPSSALTLASASPSRSPGSSSARQPRRAAPARAMAACATPRATSSARAPAASASRIPLRNGCASATPPGPSSTATTTGRCAATPAARPAHHRHHGPLRPARDREVVHQPPGPRQPEPERAAGRDALAQRRRDVRDARPGVAHDDLDPAPPGALARRQLHAPAAAVADRVARDLRHRGGDVLALHPGAARTRRRGRAPPARPPRRPPRRRGGRASPRSSPPRGSGPRRRARRRRPGRASPGCGRRSAAPSADRDVLREAGRDPVRGEHDHVAVLEPGLRDP